MKSQKKISAKLVRETGKNETVIKVPADFPNVEEIAVRAQTTTSVLRRILECPVRAANNPTATPENTP